VGSSTGLDDVERRKILSLSGLELRLFGRLACSPNINQKFNYATANFGINMYVTGCAKKLVLFSFRVITLRFVDIRIRLIELDCDRLPEYVFSTNQSGT
jgi:hypothetical protein